MSVLYSGNCFAVMISFCLSSIALEQLLSPDCCLPYPQVLAAGILLARETRQDSQQVSSSVVFVVVFVLKTDIKLNLITLSS